MTIVANCVRVLRIGMRRPLMLCSSAALRKCVLRPLLVAISLLVLCAGAAALAADDDDDNPDSAIEQLVARMDEKNKGFVELRKSSEGPAARAEAARREADRLEAERDRHRQRFQHVRDVGDLTDSIGQLLQRYVEQLPLVDEHREHIRERRAEIADVRRALLELQVQLSDLRDMRGRVSRLLEIGGAALDDDQRAIYGPQIEERLKDRRGLVEPLIKEYQDLLDVLVLRLDRGEEELIQEALEFREYINERILWIPTMPVLAVSDGPAAWDTLLAMFSPKLWQQTFDTLMADARRQPMPYLLLVLVLIMTAATRRKMRRRLQRHGQRLEEGGEAEVGPMVESIVSTLVIAVPWPIVLWIISWRCHVALDATTFMQAISIGFYAAALALLNIELLRQISRKRGLAEAHLGAKPEQARKWRRDLWLVLLVAVPLAFIVASARHFQTYPPQPALGRLLFVIAMLAMAIVGHRALRSTYGLVPAVAADEPRTWLTAMRSGAYLIGVGMPLILAIVAGLGYIYAAERIFVRLQLTLWLVEAVMLIGIMSQHWVEVAARSKSKAEVAVTDVQSRRMFGSVGALLLAIGCYAIWFDVLPALRVLDQWQLWNYTAAVPLPTQAAVATSDDATPLLPVQAVTVADLVLAIIIFVMTSIAARNLPGLLELLWFQRLPLDSGARYALTSLSRYMIVLIGGVWLFRSLGVSWANVQWLVAGIGVGLGFGLQEIFANFVSGLIVLFERPIRVGDIVTIGGVSGTVTRIRARATSITDGDRKELIVPNKEFITGQLVNWTLSDSILRVVVKAGVSYGSDTAKVVNTLLDVAATNPHLMRTPAPMAIMTGFGQDALEFELRAFVSAPEKITSAQHSLHMEINRALREAGISMPFGNTDINIRSLPEEAIAIALQAASGSEVPALESPQ